MRCGRDPAVMLQQLSAQSNSVLGIDPDFPAQTVHLTCYPSEILIEIKIIHGLAPASVFAALGEVAFGLPARSC